MRTGVRVARTALFLLAAALLPACGKSGDPPASAPLPPPIPSPWIFMAGTSNCNEGGVYGVQGVADPANHPPGRVYTTPRQDSTGNFWLFGGTTIVNWGPYGYLNDLWKFDGTNWTWVSGPNTADGPGTWGTKGSAGPANLPSGRGGGA